ncbi:MAG: hypothetical protein N4A46_11455 [Schleiferiaceae bacterium]|nr:hypothetical protein [Schleiferiaceae bacterium]
MKKFLLAISILSLPFITSAQSVKAKLGTGGNFLILDSGDPGLPFTDPAGEKIKLLIGEDGEVNWFLDGANFFVEDGAFEAFPDDSSGVLYKYDFIQVDGANGRIGFNLLNGRSDFDDGSTPGSGQVDELNSSVTLFGSIASRFRLIDLDEQTDNEYLLRQDDHIIIVQSDDIGTGKILLPDASTCIGREYYVKRNDIGGLFDNLDIEVSVNGQTIDGSTTREIGLDQNEFALLVSDGINGWWTVSAGSTDLLVIPDATAGSVNINSESEVIIAFTANDQSFDVVLPPASSKPGKRITIKRDTAGAERTGCILNIKPNATGTEFLDQYTNASPYQMTQTFESLTVRSTGSKWLIVGGTKGISSVVTANDKFAVGKTNALGEITDTTFSVDPSTTSVRVKNGNFSVGKTAVAGGPMDTTFSVNPVNSSARLINSRLVVGSSAVAGGPMDTTFSIDPGTKNVRIKNGTFAVGDAATVGGPMDTTFSIDPGNSSVRIINDRFAIGTTATIGGPMDTTFTIDPGNNSVRIKNGTFAVGDAATVGGPMDTTFSINPGNSSVRVKNGRFAVGTTATATGPMDTTFSINPGNNSVRVKNGTFAIGQTAVVGGPMDTTFNVNPGNNIVSIKNADLNVNGDVSADSYFGTGNVIAQGPIVSQKLRSISSNETLTTTDRVILVTGTTTITLPNASTTATGVTFIIKNVNTAANVVTVQGSPTTQLFDGTQTLNSGDFVTVVCNSTTGQWYVIAQ